MDRLFAAGNERPLSRDELIRAIRALPALPAVALRVMQVAQDARSSASDLALVISTDPGLSARVLRVANSAAYRRSRDVSSVQEALVVLGFVQARNIAVSTAITTVYAMDALNALFRVDAFWRHSLAVAFRASEQAAKTRRIDVPSAFTAGVLHNMGRLAMFHADRAGVDQAIAESVGTGRALEEIEREMLGYDHAELGGLLAQKWKLPIEICLAISQHHNGALPHPSLASLVAEADHFCVSQGVLPGYMIPAAPGTAPVTSAELGRLMRQVDSLMELVRGDQVGVRLVV